MKVSDLVHAFMNISNYTVTLIPEGAPSEIIQDSEFLSSPESFQEGNATVSSFRIDADEIRIYCR